MSEHAANDSSSPVPSDAVEPTGESSKRSRRGPELLYLAIAILPPALLSTVLAVAFVDESSDGRWLTEQVKTAGPMGQSISDSAAKDWFEEITSRTDTRSWSQVLATTERLGHGLDGYVQDTDALVPADREWSAMPYVKMVSDRNQSATERILNLKSSEKPVWMPIHFNGMSTWLTPVQESRELVRMLERRFRVEFHAGENEKAIDALEGIGTVTKAFDWPLYVVTELVRIQRLDTQRELIRESLLHDQWTAEDLDRLRGIVGHQDNLDDHWSEIVRGAGAELMSEFGTFDRDTRNRNYRYGPAQMFPFGMSASHLRPYLSYLDELASVEGAGTWKHVRNMDKVADTYFGRSWHRGRLRRARNLSLVAIPFADGNQFLDYYAPSFESVSNAMATMVLRRRWTLTAIGIKQFEIQEGNFPSKLQELTKVGLTPDDWEFVTNEPFGYLIGPAGEWDFEQREFIRISEDPSVQQAELWTPDINNVSNENATSGPFPPIEDNTTSGARLRLTTIR